MRISVVIPVFNGARTLPVCLQAVANSRYPAAECLVINDGSTDGSASLAERMGAMVLSTGGRSGPARARNLGARRASGDLLLFLDADVAVHPDAIGRIAERFEAEPELDALIGAYDDAPAGAGFVSQFKNLMHAFVHRHGNRRAFSFWCGCGAVKRAVFFEQGGLDESYRRPSIEDIEFGFRMLQSGRSLALDPEIQCQHLKVWTLWNLVRTDVLERGIPWTELILRTRFLPDDLNLRWSQRVSVILSALLVLAAGFEAGQIVNGGNLFAASIGAGGILLSLGAICFLNRAFYRFLASRKGWWFALSAIWMHILYFVYSGAAFALGAAMYAFRAVLPGSAREVSLNEYCEAAERTGADGARNERR
jgi:glycosyltransferase involved in cell wall biosynthesis